MAELTGPAAPDGLPLAIAYRESAELRQVIDYLTAIVGVLARTVAAIDTLPNGVPGQLAAEQVRSSTRSVLAVAGLPHDRVDHGRL